MLWGTWTHAPGGCGPPGCCVRHGHPHSEAAVPSGCCGGYGHPQPEAAVPSGCCGWVGTAPLAAGLRSDTPFLAAVLHGLKLAAGGGERQAGAWCLAASIIPRIPQQPEVPFHRGRRVRNPPPSAQPWIHAIKKDHMLLKTIFSVTTARLCKTKEIVNVVLQGHFCAGRKPRLQDRKASAQR